MGFLASTGRLHSICKEYAQPIADFLGTTRLPEHADTIFLSFMLFLAVHQVIGPLVSRVITPETYGKLTGRGRNNWLIHIVSQVHVIIVVPFALTCLNIESLDKDRVFGWDKRAGFVQGIACGYFLWDSLDAIINFIDIGFVIHGVACLAVYSMGFKPFVAYYGIRCLLWEASTFFLNIHWFLDKLGQTGSKLQFANAFVLLLTFFFVRIIYGGMISFVFIRTLYRVRKELPLAYLIIYGIGNLALQGLNWLWFSKMIAALRKRFQEPQSQLPKITDPLIQQPRPEPAPAR
ncbi:hypothetical protein HGRIS_012939 [Hohenbuehelia grisea]|uniref:TLC domain-containing protein n=1 Tax=Hohenbuehelia grisea TaxID=104357 RepID=A0ABR3IU51_9AGAR